MFLTVNLSFFGQNREVTLHNLFFVAQPGKPRCFKIKHHVSNYYSGPSNTCNEAC